MGPPPHPQHSRSQHCKDNCNITGSFQARLYCNSLYLNLPSYQLSRLQNIQNSLARAVCKLSKHQHISPHLQSLHWLKIPQRIHYKLLSTTYTLLQHQQPTYLYSLINTQPTRSTRSASLVTLHRPPTTRLKLSDRSFHHFIPQLWQTLPGELRQPSTPGASSLLLSRNQFLTKLETFRFGQSYPHSHPTSPAATFLFFNPERLSWIWMKHTLHR